MMIAMWGRFKLFLNRNHDKKTDAITFNAPGQHIEGSAR